ncbi:unnamed protein product [Medioppia subpectinata]|uniref:Uncharacterized protein n=1 Tax=Medioppia subpectinata TaxID=1979941 RepID=A0A7R9PZW3_9ACAR|nr:unnamed protein product [Medioppia subpectinata]CAG2107411.1 unnamed protein product [Medioppia subpectinata]
MKLVVIFALICVSFATQTKSVSQKAADLGFKTFDHDFKSFKITHNKQYSTAEEEEQRKVNFLHTLQVIAQHNEGFKRGIETHEMGVNQFADMSDAEYQSMFVMPDPTVQKPEPADAYIAEPEALSSVPQSLDWRQKGKVTPVKNQGGCGSCWAFSVIGGIESAYAVKQNKNNLDLSEEQLVDCMNSKCGGQWIYDGYKYVIAHGVENEAQYPYSAGSGHYNQCQEKASAPHTHIKGYKSLGKGISESHPLATDQEIMAAIEANGPISMMFNANGDAFRNYKTGVITQNDMGWTGSHAVVIVGWGTEGGHDYWIIKNSWGATWGDHGYFKMVRGQNLRHVNEYLYFPDL